MGPVLASIPCFITRAKILVGTFFVRWLLGSCSWAQGTPRVREITRFRVRCEESSMALYSSNTTLHFTCSRGVGGSMNSYVHYDTLLSKFSPHDEAKTPFDHTPRWPRRKEGKVAVCRHRGKCRKCYHADTNSRSTRVIAESSCYFNLPILMTRHS